MNEHDFLKRIAAEHLDGEQARRRIVHKKEKTRWLVPVAACVAGAVVICTAVPPVRAAIAQWFRENHSVENYVAQPQDARSKTPELDRIIAETTTSEAAAGFADVAPAWREWAGSLGPKVGDIYFDGDKLIVGFDTGGGAAELLGIAADEGERVEIGAPPYITINGVKYDMLDAQDSLMCTVAPAETEYEKYAAYSMGEGEGISEEGKRALEEAKSCRFTMSLGGFSTSGKNMPGAAETEERKKFQAEYSAFDHDYVPAEVVTYDASTLQSGVQQVKAVLPVASVKTIWTQGSDGTMEGRREAEYIGKLILAFSFDPAAGNGKTQSYEIGETKEFTGEGTFACLDLESDADYAVAYNCTKDLSGVSMTVKRMEVTASGAGIYAALTCPDRWTELEKESFLNHLTPIVLGDGQPLMTSGETYGLEEGGEDEGFRINLKMLPSELAQIKTFTIVPALGYYTGYDGADYEEGKPAKLPKEGLGYQEESARLAECAVDFMVAMK